MTLQEMLIIEAGTSIVDSPAKMYSLCNQNTIRSNHYHYSDWHIMHVLEALFIIFIKV